MGILFFFAAMALAADVLALYPQDFRDAPFLLPSWSHPLGTDDMGRDILTGLMIASRVSLLIGLSAAFASVFIGTVVGLAAGYAQGLGGELCTGIIDAALLVPVLPLLVILAAYIGPNSFNIVIVIACIGWCATARAVRAKTLQLRETQFVEALKGLGFSKTRIIFRHLLPNVAEVVSAKFVFSVASAMISDASLGFLGLGDPYQPSWGKMVHDAFQRGGFAGGMWNWYLPPGLCITLCTMGFVLLGFYWEQRDTAERPGEMII
jgi:peptide/nickel transport system permease protein